MGFNHWGIAMLLNRGVSAMLKVDEPMLVDWKTLKKLGWPYSRQHTFRMIDQGRFPQPKKFGDHPGSRVAWRWQQVRPFLE